MKTGRDKRAFRMTIRIHRALLGIFVAAAMVSSASATDLYWSGDGVTQGGAGTWNVADQRWGTVAGGPYSTIWNNSNNDTAIFGSTAGAVGLGEAITVGGLTFNTTGYSIISTITITFGADGAIFTDTGVTNTIGQKVLSGSATVEKTGTGILRVGDNSNSGDNTTFTGALKISGGEVWLSPYTGTTKSVGSLILNGGYLRGYAGWGINQSTTPVTVTGNSIVKASSIVTTSTADRSLTLGALSIGAYTLEMGKTTGNATTAVNFGATTLTGNAIFNVSTATGGSGDSIGALGAISGDFGITKNGTGTLKLNAASSYTGTTTVSGGTLRLDAAGALPSGSAVILNGGTLHNAGINAPVNQTAGSLTLTANSTITQYYIHANNHFLLGGHTLSFSSAVGDWTGLNLTLRGSLGPTTLRFGTSASGLDAVTQLPYITHTLLSGAVKTVTINGSGYVTSGLSDGWRSGGTHNWSNSGAWTDGMIAGGEDATVTFWGTSSDSTTTVDAPTTIGHIRREGNKNATINSSGGYILTLAVSSGMSTINAGGSNTLTISAPLAGDDGLEIVAGGTILLSGDNIYTGGTKLTGGILQVGHANALGGDLSGTIALNGGTIQSSDGTARSFGNAVTIGGNFTVGGTGNMTFSNTGPSALGATRTITVTTAGVRATFAQAFSGDTFGITKAGTGTLVLTGASTYTGVTTISVGTLEVTKLANGGSNSSIGASTDVSTNLLLANGTTLRYTGTGDSTLRSFRFNGNAAGINVTLDASGTGAINFTNTANPTHSNANQTRTLTLRGTNTGANTLAANLANNGSGALSVTKTDAGTWTLSGVNTYTGVTTINAGTLALGAAGTLNTANNVVLAGGTLSAGAFNNSLGTLTQSGSSTIVLGSGTLSFANSSALAGTWSGTLDLTGTLGATSLRFGTDASGLTEAQLLLITCNGQSVVLNPAGYVILAPSGGTLFLFE